jgi:DNA replication protein DnaC
MTKPKPISKVISRIEKPTFYDGLKEPYSGPCKEDCPICNGLGWVRQEVPPWDKNFGRLIPCPNVPPENLRIIAPSGLDYNQADLTWDKVKPINNSQEVAQEVKNIVDRGYGFVFLWGSHGLAKTLILKIAVAEVLRKHNIASYARAADILDNIRDAFDLNDPRESSMSRVERWLSSDLLSIDELSRVSMTPWVREKLFQIIDKRYISAMRQDAVTLIASNEGPNELRNDPTGIALLDRFRDSRSNIFKLDGLSARPVMKKDVKL